MNTMNFNTLMGIENESTPTEATNTKETSTFDKVVTNAAKIGVIAGATVLTISAVNAIVGEVAVGVKAGKAGFNAAKSHIAAKKAEKNAVKASDKATAMAAFTKSLTDAGYSKEEALELTKAEYGLED
jgi:hypothetical protein